MTAPSLVHIEPREDMEEKMAEPYADATDCKVIVFANQKGGVGKSTCTGGFAEGLARRGYRVLMLDCDPQGNLSFTCGADMSAPCVDSLLAPGRTAGRADVEMFVQHPAYADMIASGPIESGDNALEARAKEIAVDTAAGAWRLDDALAPFREVYDYILVDTPPNMDSLTVNALCAADEVVIPCDMDIQSAKALGVFLTYLSRFGRMNSDLKVTGVLLNQFRRGVNSAAGIVEGVRSMCEVSGVPVFDSTIRSTDVIKRAHEEGIGVYEAVSAKSGSARVDIDFESAIDQFLAIEREEVRDA